MRKNWQLGALGVIMVWYCVARYGVVSPGVAQPVWCGVVTVMPAPRFDVMW